MGEMGWLKEGCAAPCGCCRGEAEEEEEAEGEGPSTARKSVLCTRSSSASLLCRLLARCPRLRPKLCTTLPPPLPVLAWLLPAVLKAPLLLFARDTLRCFKGESG